MNTETPAWQADLTARWAQPHRRHHGPEHLHEVLAALDSLAAAGESFDAETVRVAAWFHDAVYDPTRDDNEERSAQLALRLLGDDDPDAGEVARLVRLTRTHRCDPHDVDAAALCDADLSVLGADTIRYRRYATAIRDEYAAVPDAVFRSERARILGEFLGRDRLFVTPSGYAWWEARARENLAAEIARLTATPPTDEA